MTVKNYIEADLLINKIKEFKSVWDVERFVEEEKMPITTIVDEMVGKREMKEGNQYIAFSKQYVIEHPEKAKECFEKFMEGCVKNE